MSGIPDFLQPPIRDTDGSPTLHHPAPPASYNSADKSESLNLQRDRYRMADWRGCGVSIEASWDLRGRTGRTGRRCS